MRFMLTELSFYFSDQAANSSLRDWPWHKYIVIENFKCTTVLAILWHLLGLQLSGDIH